MSPKHISAMAREREDEYIARIEFERRKKAAEEHASKLKKKELDDLKKLHWMRCPKDGMELIEIDYLGVRIDKCSHCGGIYLDAGELERLFEAGAKGKGVLSKVLGVFR